MDRSPLTSYLPGKNSPVRRGVEEISDRCGTLEAQKDEGRSSRKLELHPMKTHHLMAVIFFEDPQNTPAKKQVPSPFH